MPKENTQAVMKKQMIAERTRRGEFIRSEGNKTAMRLQADGEKLVKVNLGIAEQEVITCVCLFALCYVLISFVCLCVCVYDRPHASALRETRRRAF